jgi:hypothetical protein
MNPQTSLRGSRFAWPFRQSFDFPRRPAPLALVLLLVPALPCQLFAQQIPGPEYQQNIPYNGQYAPNQQPAYAQPRYAAPAYAQTQPYAQQGFAQPQQPAQPLSAEQLEQLLAPIALYPDTLLAQMLAAATYPAQVVAADHWLQAQGNASEDQVAGAADAQSWDPSVKALTAFPLVLAQMDRDLQWTTDLGNAYYNQPQDVLQTVQVMRQRAQAAGNLQNTPQQAVSYNQGYVQLAPANPQVVYVPAYNPWDVYGQPVQPYPGFSLLGALQSFAGSAPVKFGLGTAMGAFNNTSFGWMGWALNWLTQSILFHQNNYSSQSTSVAHWASARGGQPGFSQRPAFARQPDAYNRAPGNDARPASEYDGRYQNPGQEFARPPARYPEGYAENRSYAENRPQQSFGRNYPAPVGNFVRPAYGSYSFNRPEPQNYARPAYAPGFYGRSPQSFASRPATAYASPQQAWREPAPQRGDYRQGSFQASSGRGFAEPAKAQHSGGFHLFGLGSHHDAGKSYGGSNYGFEKSYGGGHAPRSYKAEKSYKAPRHSGGGGGHSGGGGGLFGHHGGGHRH